MSGVFRMTGLLADSEDSVLNRAGNCMARNWTAADGAIRCRVIDSPRIGDAMRQILLMILAAAAIDAAAITGNIDFPNGGFTVDLSGADFSANIDDNDHDDCDSWGDGVNIPFLAPSVCGFVEAGNGSDAGVSSVTYNGVFYVWEGDSFFGTLTPGTPIATTLYVSLSLESPDQIITGPGTYPQTYAVQLYFCVGVEGSPTSYCETDTGTATAAWNATPGNAVFVDLPGGLDLSIVVPEPSTLSYVGLALCFVVGIAIKSRRN